MSESDQKQTVMRGKGARGAGVTFTYVSPLVAGLCRYHPVGM